MKLPRPVYEWRGAGYTSRSWMKRIQHHEFMDSRSERIKMAKPVFRDYLKSISRKVEACQGFWKIIIEK